MIKPYTKLTLIILLSINILSSCADAPPKQDNSLVIDNNPTEPSATETENKPKTDAEIAKEIVTAGIDLTKTVIKTMKINDSIKTANREQMYGYRIGFPISSEEQVFEVYNKLTDRKDIYVLKESKKDYHLIKYEGKSKQELENAKEEFEKLIGQDASVINIMSLCSKNKKLMRGDNLAKRKEDVEIPCLICDK
jgi:hypothetical protein